MTKFSKLALCALVIGASVFTSCSDDDETQAAPEKPSIYARLGGTTMVADPDNPGQMIEQGRLSYRKVVNSTVGLIVADVQSGASGNLGAHFAPVLTEVGAGNTTNLAILVDNLTDFFSFNTGGTNAVNTYSGLDMVNAHNPATNPRMGVKSTNANYDKFEGYVGAAAVANGVPANSELYNDVVAVLESLRAPIVQQ
ncbi:globin family protein [Flavobacterium koreense]